MKAPALGIAFVSLVLLAAGPALAQASRTRDANAMPRAGAFMGAISS